MSLFPCLPARPAPATCFFAELPVAGAYSGIGQGVLRLRAQSSDAFKSASLRKAYKHVSTAYPGKPVYATLTANVILKSTTHVSFSVYFGQSFGSARAVFFGQEHDADSGEVSRLFSEYVVEQAGDLRALPIRFTTEDFSEIYKRNFALSNVSVHSVVNLVYFLSVGLENYETERSESVGGSGRRRQGPVRLF